MFQFLNSLEFEFRNFDKMFNKNLSDMMREALKFLQFDDIPSMKELNTRYRKLALIKHPDKNGGSDSAKEDYQHLLNCYRLIGNYIVDNVTDDDATEEEMDHVTTFKNFNFDQRNKYSHTILIENKLTFAWRKVLVGKIGDPEDKGHNGMIFRLKEFKVDEDVFSITVTLYEAPKDNQPKLHIQSSSQYANDEFTLKELPALYTEVRKVTPPDMLGVSVEAESSEAAKTRRTRGRPSKQSAKSIRTVKDLVKYCKVQSCKFTTKVNRDMSAHTKIHQRENTFDLQRNLTLEESVTAMDCVASETDQVTSAVSDQVLAPAPPAGGSIGYSSEAFEFGIQEKYIQCQEENKKSKDDLAEKDKIIEGLENKIKELEDDIEKMKRKFTKEENMREKDLGQMKAELNKAMDKASSLCEDNTILRTQVKTFENREIANLGIQQKYESLVNVVKVSTGCQTEDQNDDENIEVLVRNKESGYRRTDPSSPPTAMQTKETSEEHHCNLCDFKTKSLDGLNKHLKQKHHKCDICERVLKNPVLLRSHLKEIHDKKDGTMIECNKCKFSALNKQHLNTHIHRHHKIQRKSTIPCRFGNRCYRSNCQYVHEEPQYIRNTRKPNISPWSNPAFLGGAASEESFPFLERSCQCQGQNRRRGA